MIEDCFETLITICEIYISFFSLVTQKDFEEHNTLSLKGNTMQRTFCTHTRWLNDEFYMSNIHYGCYMKLLGIWNESLCGW